MKRLIQLVAIIAAIVSPLNLISAQEKSSADGAVIQRLDSILERLTKIEHRLSKLEELQRRANQWWVDGDGILRSTNGRAIGFWGIDVIPRIEMLE